MTEQTMTRHAARTIRDLTGPDGRPARGRRIDLGDICEVWPERGGLRAVEYPVPAGVRRAFVRSLDGLVSLYRQSDWAHVPYPAPGREDATLKTAGAGPVCAAMIAETMTGRAFTPADAAELSLRCGARLPGGTDLRVLGAALAQTLGVPFAVTDNSARLRAHLLCGKPAIACVSGDRAGRPGLFSREEGALAVFAEEGGLLTLGDPDDFPTKYAPKYPWRRMVARAGRLLRAAPADLDEAGQNRSPRYYLFG